MQRTIGTAAFGIRTPIIKKGDDLENIVVDSLIDAIESNSMNLKEMDVLAITESLLARAQGNYCTADDITHDLNSKFDDSIGVLFPITSRNRFSIILKAIANTRKKIVLFLTYPSDEVGNRIMDTEILTKNNINIYSDTFDESKYRELVGDNYKHPFTGIDYVSLYKSFAVDDNIEIYLSNNPVDILKYTKDVLIANIHDRHNLHEILVKNGANKVYGLDEIMDQSVDGSGYNPEYGLYGSNLSTDTSLKLFPRDADIFVNNVQKKIFDRTGVKIEVMVYGDGAFKDPVGKIWELADPVVSPAYTENLEGTPNELKLKYIADNDLVDLNKEDAANLMRDKINKKTKSEVSESETLGTTPRRLTDLLGSLADLISGSGDKGTPIVLIKGYFDNFASE
ncbi:MAG: coenzyme F420-0:L-glutamate ligase [Tissierellia bacterium]|nr:coenzyme F420-0:L-glutamate ligase [Tissierellia bacterium]